MTIRFKCAKCASVLKIKEELAGTGAKCPKCKTPFTVPEPTPEPSTDEPHAGEEHASEQETKPAPATLHTTAADQPSAAAETPSNTVPASADTEDDDSPPSLVSAPEVRSEELADSHAVAATESETESEPILRMDDDDDFDSPPVLSLSDDEISVTPAPAPIVTPPPAVSERPSGKPKKKAKSSKDDDFDPADFLSEGPPPSKWKAPTDFSSPFDNEDPLQAETPPPRSSAPSRPSKAAPEAGSSAAAASAAWDHKMAAKQMQNAIKESRKEAAAARADGTQPEGFDYAGFFREFGLKGVAGLTIILVVSYGTYTLFNRMMGGGLTLPTLGYVTGTVTLDGAPLEGATVFFAPQDTNLDDKKRERARTSIGLTDAKGHYRMQYVDGIEGVAAGQCRVWLSKIDPQGKIIIPGEYSELNLLVKEVKTGRQTIDFTMTSPKK